MEKIQIDQMDEILNSIIKQNKTVRFGFELNSTKNNPERQKDIKLIMSLLGSTLNEENCQLDQSTKSLEKIIVESHKKKSNNSQNSGKLKLDQIYDKMNEQTLQWKWSKLSIPQQKDRIEHFLNLNIKCDEKRKKAKKMLFDLIETEKLKKNAIIYDSEKKEIKEICIKEYNDFIKSE